MTKSIMQDKRECYISGFSTNLARHHIYGGGRRQLSDIWGCWVWLRADWHNMADYGVHGKDGHALDMRLKRECQKRFEELYAMTLSWRYSRKTIWRSKKWRDTRKKLRKESLN